MDFYVSITAPVEEHKADKSVVSDLNSGNLRGEPRWERNCASALLAAGHTVYTKPDIWTINNPPNFINGIPDGKNKDLINISHGSPVSCNEITDASFYFLHFFCSPGEDLVKHMHSLHDQYNVSRIAVTHSFETTDTYFLRRNFPQTFTKLTFPYIESVNFNADQFDKKLLLWSGRQLHMEVLDPTRHERTDLILKWVATKLKEDKDLRFAIFSGYNPNDLSFYKIEDYSKWMWGFPAFSSLLPYREQITVYPALDWSSCLEIMRDVKMIVHPPQNFGGPTVEAAALGIPSIGLPPVPTRWCEGYQIDTKLSNFNQLDSNYLHIVGDGKQSNIVELLDSLYSNKDFYHRVGNSLRQYVHQHYTYGAFVNNIMSILKNKGAI